MPLDAKFFETVNPLLMPGMGTEHVGLLLYSLTRMTRPRNLLEVGMGFTTPFLAMALHDNVQEFGEDAANLDKQKSTRSSAELSRLSVLDGIKQDITTVGPVLNEIKRQQAMHGIHGRFEVLSLLEPHKFRQGSVTMVRKLPAGPYRIRYSSFEKEIEARYGKTVKPFPKL